MANDVLRRMAAEIRSSSALAAMVPLTASEREDVVAAAMAQVMGEERGGAARGLPMVATGSGLATGSVRVTGTGSATVTAGLATGSSTGSVTVTGTGSVTVTGSGSAAADELARRRGRLRPAIIILSAAVALAAVALLWLRGASPSVEPLPVYAMLVTGEQPVRGATAAPAPNAPVEVRRATRLTISLSPPSPGAAERDALFRLLLVRGERAAMLDPAVRRGGDGALTIEAPAGELLGPQADGAVELVVLLGRQLPTDGEVRAIATGQRRPPAHVQLLRQPLRLVDFSQSSIEVLLGGCRAVLSAAPSAAGAPAASAASAASTDDAAAAPLRCQVASGAPLRLWIGVAAARSIELLVDDRPLAAGASPAIARAGGVAFELPIPAEARRLEVRLAGRSLAAWQLAVAAESPPLRAISAALAAGELAAAEAALTAAASAPSAAADPAERLALVRLRAKLSSWRGGMSASRTLRREAVQLARSLGHLSAESDELVAILYDLFNEHAFAEAAPLLTRLDAHGQRYAEGAMHREMMRGVLSMELGDLGAALSELRRAAAIAERIGDDRKLAGIRAPIAQVLQSLGRAGESLALIEAESQRGAAGADPCTRVDAFTSAGWLLRDLEAPRALSLVDRAAELAATSCPRLLPIALVNRGWLLASARRFGEARAVARRLATLVPQEDRVVMWAQRLEVEIAIGEEPAAAAVRKADQLVARAVALCSVELAYEAHLLRARALIALEQPAPAAAAFAEAERALALWSRSIPLGEGRTTFLQRHEQLAFAAIPFFLDEIRGGDAGARHTLAATVRSSLARFAVSLADGGRARAQALRGGRLALSSPPASASSCALLTAAPLPVEQAAPLVSSLFLHPHPGGLLVLVWRAATSATSTAATALDFVELSPPVPAETPAALAARIAAAAAPLIAGASRVHLHLHHTLAALPVDRALRETLRGSAAPPHVAVATEVTAPARAAAAFTAAPRALLIANPRLDLWAASASAPRLVATLTRLGFAVDLLEGDRVTRAALLERLADPCTALFHYDGHAAAAGAARDRVDDALLLAAGATLTAAEILELPRVPPAVVLNGCTTAAPEGLGLAQSFLAAGAEQVIASLDELDATAAARFSEQLFAGAKPRPAPLDLVQLFAAARSELTALRAFER